MYIVSTTFVVEPSVHAQWYDFFTKKFVPSLGARPVVATRVLTNTGDAHYTYSLQIDASDIADYQLVEAEHIAQASDFCTAMFGEKVLLFSTLLKRIEI